MSKTNFYMRGLSAIMAVMMTCSSVVINVAAYGSEMESIDKPEIEVVYEVADEVVGNVEVKPEEIEIDRVMTKEEIDIVNKEPEEYEEEVDKIISDMNEVAEPVEEVEEVVVANYYDVPLSADLQSYIFKLCEERSIDPAMVIAIIDRESKFNAESIGDSGASLGLMQIQPRWHSARMDRLGCSDLLNPYDNVTVGIDILAELINTGNSIEWVLMAYNGGHGHAYSNINRGVVTEYVTTVLYISQNLKGE